ncbi:MAG: peptide chain release factor 2 [Acholeplasmatales bacterium]|nr:peptide chain release factor 2 [Acholeplasmatales bacterium]
MEKYEINKFIEEYDIKLKDLDKALGINQKEIELKELNKEIEDPNFWSDQKKAQEVIKKSNLLKDTINSYNDLSKQFNDINDLKDSALEDEELMSLLEIAIEEFKDTCQKVEEKALLSGKYDMNNVILEIHPGAGGTESMDWADMLYRMYNRFCARNGFKVTLLDYQAGDEAGIKSVTIQIDGDYAYGLFKGERGVHRLVRISPFDSNARRHTSFCSVDIAPLIDNNNDLVIPDEDLRIDTFCSSGPGGQGVNTTYSAVRITHKPTGLFVACQKERSQIRNKEIAMTLLKSKLLDLEIKKQEEEIAKEKGTQMGINFGSQIRSYVFCPYTLVKDHRTDYEMGNITAVMDGDILGFMQAYLKMKAGEANE